MKQDLLVIHDKTVEYYQNSTVLDFLFASHLGGKSTSPVISGAVFHNAEEMMCDLHLMRFKYSDGYKQVIERDQLTGGVIHSGSNPNN
jgi:hypothetical protein